MATAETLLAKAQAYNENGQYQRVLNLLPDEVLEEHNHADLYAEKGQAYYRMDNEALCDIMVNKALQINPLQAKALHFKGNIESGNKRYEKAIEYYTKAIEVAPQFAYPYNGLGLVYEEQKKYTQAIEYYTKSIEYNPNLDLPYVNLGNVYVALGDLEKAWQNFQQAITLNPNYEGGINGLGNVCMKKGEFDKAIEYYKQAIVLKPQNSILRDNLGLAYFNKSEFEKAIESFTEALKISSSFTIAYYDRAFAYEAKKDYENALADYETYVKLADAEGGYYLSQAKAKIVDLQKLINSEDYSYIAELVKKIKALLLFNDGNITHYTSLSAAKILVLNESSQFRLSEGAFLNDTSEGRELFSYLQFNTTTYKAQQVLAQPFGQKPFIGSFVAAYKYNDLTLWRMYGKEDKEEARGCAITINPQGLLEKIKDKVLPLVSNGNMPSMNEAFSFYKVAYLTQDAGFILPGANKDEVKTLNEYMHDLLKKAKEVQSKKTTTAEDRQNITVLLNEIAYMFKSDEYQHEQELRLVLSGVGFDKKVDIGAIMPRVYIELVNIRPLIQKITIGPKVDRADEWAAAFHYSLDKDNLHPEICISHLPYK